MPVKIFRNDFLVDSLEIVINKWEANIKETCGNTEKFEIRNIAQSNSDKYLIITIHYTIEDI